MPQKYEIIKELSKVGARGGIVHRIKHLESGMLGGWIEKESNLSQKDECWIADDAEVSGEAVIWRDAQVYGSAIILEHVIVGGRARVYGKAKLSGEANIKDEAQVYGYARICGTDVYITGKAKIHGKATILQEAHISGNAEVYGNSVISGSSNVAQGAKVRGKARVMNHANVIGDAVIDENIWINYTIYRNSKMDIIAGSLNIYPDDKGNYILYKQVAFDGSKYFSIHDPTFEYKIGKVAKVELPDMSNASCSSGIHLSVPFYNYPYITSLDGKMVVLQCQVNIDDIITCQEGKVRCKKCFVIREVP